MCCKKLHPFHHMKYLEVYLYDYLDWTTHINQLCVKHVKGNVMLSKH